MLKSIFFICVVFFCTLLSGRIHTQTKPVSPTKLEVFYFHSTNRCATCNAVENNSKKILEESYKTEMNNGVIKFTSVNIDDEANQNIVEKYQISYSSLLLVKVKGKKTDFTNTAFQYARTDPAKFVRLLKAEIDKNLK